MRDTPVLPFAADARLRRMPEARIVDHLVFHGWQRADRERDPHGARREALAALSRWRALGLPGIPAGADGFFYDPAEVFLIMRWAGWKAGDPFWRPHHVAIERARVLSFHPPGTARDVPPDPRALPPRRFTVHVRRRFHPRYVTAASRLRMPLPYADAALRDLEVALDATTGARGEFRAGLGHAELRLDDAPTGTVTLGARSTFVALPYAPPRTVPELRDDERILYLRDVEELARITPAVRHLAATLAAGSDTPLDRIRAFFHYLMDRLDSGPFPYEWLAAKAPIQLPLASGWFDCRLVAAFVTLFCRTLGVPARRVSGYLIYPECAGYHWWTEVWLPDAGWVPVDTWACELSASGHDVPWRSTFFAALDYRMKSEVLPRVFNRPPGVRLPAAWRVLERDVEQGATEIAVVDLATNDDVWADTIRIEMGDPVGA